MKKKLLQLSIIMILIVVAGIFIIEVTKSNKEIETMQSDEKLTILTTIYPVYLIGLNLTEGIDNIEVKSLINRNTGCLHDYQLTSEDMKIIASADVLVVNGGGMENFIKDITENYPDLKIIDASEGIDLLSNLTAEREDDAKVGERSTDLGETYNSHVWLDPLNYEKQIDNVKEGLTSAINASLEFKDKKDNILKQIDQNAESYKSEVQKIEEELESCQKEINSDGGNKLQAVIFHEAFAYLADRLNLSIAFSVELGPDTTLGAGYIAEIVKAIKKDSIPYLFTEEQYSTSIPRQIAAETSAKVYVIDSVVTGDGKKDSYLRAMHNNLMVIRGAAKQ